MRVSLMKNGYSQCVICHYYGDAFLYYAIFVAECEFTSIRDDILSINLHDCTQKEFLPLGKSVTLNLISRTLSKNRT